MTALEVVEPGPLTTVQDLGRPGLAALGVPESGTLDAPALRLANRLVGNPEDAACLEATLGGLVVRAHGDLTVALAGAPAPASVDGVAVGPGCAVRVPDRAELRLGTPPYGVPTLVAVRGGLDAPRLLGSAATDLLSGLGRPLLTGDRVTVGPAPARPVPALDAAPLRAPAGDDLHLRVVLGPRDDWFTSQAIRTLLVTRWSVSADSNRIGLRLTGPALERRVTGELPSEGVVAGALQVAANGQPVLFLADHPVTGGYPVAAVVVTADLPTAGHARPGQRLRFHRVAAPFSSTIE